MLGTPRPPRRHPPPTNPNPLPRRPAPPQKKVVIIAAGFDTRAYRLGRPGVKFFEVDLPHASEKKRELVERLLPADKVGFGGWWGGGEAAARGIPRRVGFWRLGVCWGP